MQPTGKQKRIPYSTIEFVGPFDDTQFVVKTRAARVHLPVRLDRHEEQVDRQHLEAVGVLVLDAGVPQDDDDGPLSAARAQVCVTVLRLLSLRKLSYYRYWTTRRAASVSALPV